jgi:nucleotide-binding universal stress UspA family protein
MKIVIGTDGSDAATHAARTAARLLGDETQSFFSRWFGQHVAQRAIKAARCPVLVIPSPD